MKSTRLLWYLAGLGALALVLTLTGVPVGTAFVITAVLACPMMMFFMMAGDHGAHHSKAGMAREREANPPASQDHIHHEARDANRSLR